MTKGSAKGSSFERHICKLLSLWWTENERDDVFWRTSGSGARAKTRSKKNQTTFGQYGDVQAIDPIGQPLIDLCTIEIKTGYSKYSYADLLDRTPNHKIQMYEKFIEQAQTDCHNAEAFSWLLITKRNRRETLICFPVQIHKILYNMKCALLVSSTIVNSINKHTFVVTTLRNFLTKVHPKYIKSMDKRWVKIYKNGPFLPKREMRRG